LELIFIVVAEVPGSSTSRWFMFRVSRFVAVVFFAAIVPGCGSDPEPTGPKETLTDKEKQQVQELNKQRQDEWSSTKVKNKK
jgi:hypothetical protein